MKITLFLTASLLVAGCAGTTPLVHNPDHPASLDAPIAPLPPPSTTLSLSESGQATTVPSRTPSASVPPHDGHHAGHGHHGDAAGAAPAATTGPTAKATYTCPHHPEVVSDQPGKCPKCKMTLVRKEAGR